MKNLILSTVGVLASILQLSANNAPKTSTFDILNDEKSVVLNLYGIIANAEIFTITDTEGEIVFSDEVEEYETKVKYNLNRLPVGVYSLKVEGDNFVEYQETTISKDQIVLGTTESYFMPVVKCLNNRLMLNALFTSEEEIRLSIFNEAGELVYAFNDKSTGSYNKSFNLEQLDKGSYSVIVSTDHFSESSRLSL